MDRKRLVVSILQFLKSSLPSLSEDSAESLSVSIDCIRDAFDVDDSDPQLQSSKSLQEIFNGYAPATTTTTTTTTTSTSPKSMEELLKEIMLEIPDQLHPSFASYIGILQGKGAFADPTQYEVELRMTKEKFVERKMTEIKAIAEAIKVEGNTKLSAQDFHGAIESYTKAIRYDGSNAIYFANRSSAYTNLKMYDKAIEDANEAIKRNPSYGKAYFRLGSALLSSNKSKEAVDAFKKSIELEPNNDVYKASLQQAESKMNGGGGMGGGMPDLGGMDLGSLSGLLNNPMMQNMAKNLMSNPQMQQMMQNGNLEEMASNMMKNPEFMNMFGGMMGKK